MSLAESTSIDYPLVTRELAKRVRTSAPQSFERGQRRMVNAVMSFMECTPARARHVVSSLVARGYARFGAHPHFPAPDVGQWTFHDAAA
ncbi:MAG: hypothetical protein RIF41_27175 [Polyangiaceae bacterium]